MAIQETIEKIGKKIREIRKDNGLSQKELAANVCSESTISQIENGTYPSIPSSTILQGICDKLGISLHDLLSYAEVNQQTLEVDTLLDLIKVLIHREDFGHAFEYITSLQGRVGLLTYQKNELDICHADCFMKTKKAEEAVPILESLQQQLEAAREADLHLLAKVCNKLGNAWFYLSNLINAHTSYTRAYQISLRFPLPDILSAQIAYNIGMTCNWLGHESEAAHYLDSAKELFEKTKDFRGLAHVYYYLGYAHKGMNHLGKAREYFQQAQALYESLHVFDMAEMTKRQYAFLILAHNEPGEAIAQMLESVEYLIANGGSTATLCFTYARIAYLFLERDDLVEAERYCSLAMGLFDEGVETKDSKFPYAYRVYSILLQKRKEYVQSIQYAFKSAEIFDKMDYDRECAYSLEVAANCYKQMGDVQNALDVSEKIIKLLSKSLPFASKI